MSSIKSGSASRKSSKLNINVDEKSKKRSFSKKKNSEEKRQKEKEEEEEELEEEELEEEELEEEETTKESKKRNSSLITKNSIPNKRARLENLKNLNDLKENQEEKKEKKTFRSRPSRIKPTTSSEALPKEVPKHLSFCFDVEDKKNHKKVFRTSWPEVTLRLCPENCVACESLDQLFTFLYQDPEHSNRLDKVYREMSMQDETAQLKSSTAGGNDEDQEESEDQSDINEIQEPHGVHIQQDPELEIMQDYQINLQLPSEATSRKSKELQEMIENEEIDKIKTHDSIALMNRLKKQILSQKRIVPLKHQQQVIDYLKKYDLSGETVEHYLPILFYMQMGSGKSLGALLPLADETTRAPKHVVIVCDLSNLGYLKGEIKSVAQKHGSTVYELFGYSQFSKVIKKEPEYLKGKILICDECHHYRCITESMVKDLEAFRHAVLTIGLTGSPLQNQVDDMYGLNVFMEVAPVQVMTFHRDDDGLKSKRQKAFISAKRREGIKYQIEKGTYEYNFLNQEGKIDINVVMKMQKQYQDRVFYYCPPDEEPENFNNNNNNSISSISSSINNNNKLKNATKSLPIRRDIHVPMTWRQTLQYIFNSGMNLTIGTKTFQSGGRNTFDVLAREIGNCMTDWKDHKIILDAPKLDSITDFVMNAHDYPIVIYSRYRHRGIDALRKRIEKRAEELGRQLNIEEFTGSQDSDARADLRKRFNGGEIDVLLMTEAGKQGIDLLGCGILIIMEVGKSQEDENQIAGRILRHNALKNKPGLVPQILRWVSTFPKSLPTPEDLRLTELDFAREARLQSPEEIDFNLVKALKKVIDDMKEDHGGTADESAAVRNAKKHIILSPLLLMLKISSALPVPSELRREWAELCGLPWPDQKEIEEQKEIKERQEKEEILAERKKKQEEKSLSTSIDISGRKRKSSEANNTMRKSGSKKTSSNENKISSSSSSSSSSKNPNSPRKSGKKTTAEPTVSTPRNSGRKRLKTTA